MGPRARLCQCGDSAPTGPRNWQTQARIEEHDVIAIGNADSPPLWASLLVRRWDCDQTRREIHLTQEVDENVGALQRRAPAAVQGKLRRGDFLHVFAQAQVTDDPGERRRRLDAGRRAVHMQRLGRLPQQDARIEVMGVQQRERLAAHLL